MKTAFRLPDLPVPAKVMVTAFVALLGAGYLVALCNIYQHHSNADLEPGLSLNDLRRVYHGLDRPPAAGESPPSPMLKMVGPGGPMRKHVEKGGEADTRALIAWLETGALADGFARAGAPSAGDPAPQDVIARDCLRCHNDGGKKWDAPYGRDEKSAPEYGMVAKFASPPAAVAGNLHLPPLAVADLIQVTHVHLISIPMFALAIGALFFLARPRPLIAAIIGPLPMLAIVLDVSSWWLARPIEGFIYGIAAAGALFGGSLAVQMGWVVASLWLGRRSGDAGPRAPERVERGEMASRH